MQSPMPAMGILAILLALLSSTSAFWKAPAPPPALAAVGTVVDEKDRPIAGARVEMVRLGSVPREEGAHAAETDREGRFRIPDLPLTRFELTVGSPEHAPLVKKGVAAPPGARTLDLGKLKLKRRGLISGQVVDPRGRPIEGATLWLRTDIPRSFQRPLLAVEKPVATTGPDGRFELRHHTMRGDQFIQACQPGYLPNWHLHDQDPSEPLRIVLEPAVQVSGRVIDSEGRPVQGAMLRATFAGSKLTLIGPNTPCPFGEPRGTDADGGFTLEMEQAGWFHLEASAPGHLSTTLERLHVPVEGVEGLEIALGRGVEVSGRVTDPRGAPIPGAEVHLFGGRSDGRTLSGADGRYRVEGVQPGEQNLRATHPDYAAESRKVRISDGGTRLDVVLRPQPRIEIRGRVLTPDGAPVVGARVVDVLETETWTGADGSFVLKVDKLSGQWIQAEKEGFGPGFLFLPSGEPDAPVVEIRLTRGTTLTGRLLGVDPEDFPWAQISLHCPSYPGVRDATVDSEGVFRIFDLPPGQWKLSVMAGDQTAAVSVDLSGDPPTVTQDIRFAPTHEVQGRVTGPDGEPVAGADVALLLQHGGATETVTDEDGAFSVRVEDGAYVATAVAKGHRRADAEHPVVVNGGPVAGVEIRLRPEVVLTGKFPGLKPGEATPFLTLNGPGLRPHPYYSAWPKADQEGGYRMENLSPGEWTVVGKIETRTYDSVLTRTATGSVTIPEGAREARLDLDFHLGDLTLTLRFADPVQSFNLELRLPDGSVLLSGYGKPSEDGRVHLPKLQAGSYRLRLKDRNGTPLLDEPVELTSDQEIVVSPPAGK